MPQFPLCAASGQLEGGPCPAPHPRLPARRGSPAGRPSLRVYAAPPRLDVGADATRPPRHWVRPQRGVNSAAAAGRAEALQILPLPPAGGGARLGGGGKDKGQVLGRPSRPARREVQTSLQVFACAVPSAWNAPPSPVQVRVYSDVSPSGPALTPPGLGVSLSGLVSSGLGRGPLSQKSIVSRSSFFPPFFR